MLNKNLDAICAVLEQKQADNIVALDISKLCSWADYLVIAAAANKNQMKGLVEAVRECMINLSMDLVPGAGVSGENSWNIIDGGTIAVSLMDSDARKFYALEELWFEADIVYGSVQGTSKNPFSS
ncbi:MAG: ribosome silencing factor [Spirochaeta sp. LUC14_002_19_P3]|nr:MAG: ribosome silencing factor [Spirochaeta sp. LUC14_002_19_P3]